MGKKKHKINKISEQEYLSYIAGLKNDAALFNANGDLVIPDAFAENNNGNDDDKSE